MSGSSRLVSAVVLSYNSKKLGSIFVDCMKSLVDTAYPSLEIVLVDNCSSDNSASEIADKFKQIRVVKLPQNLGYSGGNDEGAKSVSQESKYIVFLNTDVLLKPDWLTPMVQLMEQNASIGVLGTEGGAKTLGGLTIFLPRLKRPFYAPIAQGYCLMVRHELFKRLGGFNPRIFMYEDEVDLCDRVHLLGYQVAIITTDSVRHLGSQSAKANSMQPLQTYLLARNNFYVLYESMDSARLPLAIILRILHSVKRCLYFKDSANMKAVIRGVLVGLLEIKKGAHPSTGRQPLNLQVPPLVVDFAAILFPVSKFGARIINRLVVQRLRYVD